MNNFNHYISQSTKRIYVFFTSSSIILYSKQAGFKFIFWYTTGRKYCLPASAILRVCERDTRRFRYQNSYVIFWSLRSSAVLLLKIA